MKISLFATTVAAMMAGVMPAFSNTDQNPPIVTITPDGFDVFPEYDGSEVINLPDNMDLNEGPDLPSIGPMELELNFDSQRGFVPMFVEPLNDGSSGGGGCGRPPSLFDFTEQIGVYVC